MKRRDRDLQIGYHRAGDPDHDPERCPACAPALAAMPEGERLAFLERVNGPRRARPERSAPQRVKLPARLVEPEAFTRPVAALECPEVLGGLDRLRVLGVELGTDQARALWAQLGAALGEADRHRRPRAWSYLQAWLDRDFARAMAVPFRETVTRARGEGLAILGGTERRRVALVRVGIFQVAWLRRRRSGIWSGPSADYFPGAMGISANQPDALISFTGRRIVVRGELLERAPIAE